MRTSDQKRDMDILLAWEQGETMTSIGKRYGLTQPSISRIIDKMQEKEAADPREFIIRNGSADVFLTEIMEVKHHPLIYRYATTDPRKALRLRWADAERIARERHAVICVPR